LLAAQHRGSADPARRVGRGCARRVANRLLRRFARLVADAQRRETLEPEQITMDMEFAQAEGDEVLTGFGRRQHPWAAS
jgi:hypothetical protein